MSKVVPMHGARGAELASTKGPARELSRGAWNGNLDEAELSRPGGLLLAALIQCAGARSDTLTEMAQALGVTYGYINQLRNGLRQTSQISDDFALSCASYLECPRMTVLMLAGRITPEDIFESREMVATEIPRAMKYLCDDPTWGPMVPMSVRKADYSTQFLIVRLYEKATDRQLLPGRLDPETVAMEIEKMQEWQRQRRAAVEAYRVKKQGEDSTDA